MGPLIGCVGIVGSKNQQYWRMILDRRSFVMSMFGGLAAASLGGIALSHAAERGPVSAPVAPGDLDAATKALSSRWRFVRRHAAIVMLSTHL